MLISRHDILPMIKGMLLRLVFPPHCLICQLACEDSPSLCHTCFQKITFISEPRCTICGRPFDFAIDHADICIPCQTNAPPFERARAAMYYNEASRPLITRFKYADSLAIAPLAAQMMTRAGADILPRADVIVPVPLHWRRLWSRKFNQSALLADQLAKQHRIPVLMHALKRARHTAPQASLNWQERQNNVKQAFVVPRAQEQHLLGKTVLLVDDVFTSGATIHACTQALKKAGASQVYVLTLARRFTNDSL